MGEKSAEARHLEHEDFGKKLDELTKEVGENEDTIRDFMTRQADAFANMRLELLNEVRGIERAISSKCEQDSAIIATQNRELQRSDRMDADARATAQALAVARDIHEVKKDYSRVVAGIENILHPSSTLHGLRLEEIFFIIEQNTRRYLAAIDKNITISFAYDYDFVTDQHYAIVSILDNLIINAIEASGDIGLIRVSERAAAGEIIFAVEDNGCGIKPEDFDLLFEVGYSTKFSPDTGKMSTGLGLSHVKNLTEMMGGAVSVESEMNRLTRFTVTLPLHRIVMSGEWAGEGGA
jgi:signal transduction histidine kinase